MKHSYLYLTAFLLLVSSLCYAESDNLVTISANGVRTTYALKNFRNVTVDDKNAADPKFKVAFNNGTSSVGNLRSVAIELDNYPGDDGVEIETTDETATIVWPVVTGAVYYQLVICKDSECSDALFTLKFNVNGQLIEINIPNVNGTTRSSRPMSYTITGLEPATTYYYSITALGSSGQELDEQAGAFTTLVTSVSDVDEDKLQIYSNGKRMIVDSKQSHNISFYSIGGVQLGESVVTSHCECLVTLPGVYVVVVDGKTYKISIK